MKKKDGFLLSCVFLLVSFLKSHTIFLILISSPYWKLGSSEFFAQQGLECPELDFEGTTVGGYMLASPGHAELVAILQSPDIVSNRKTCMLFNFNIPVG